MLGKRKHGTIALAIAIWAVRKTQEYKKIGAYLVVTTAGTRTIVASDTCAEVSMIEAGANDASWTEVQAARG